MFFSSNLYFNYKKMNSENKQNEAEKSAVKKVALPISNNQICSDFEQCSEFVIFTVGNQKKIRKNLVYTHLQPGLFPYWLAKKGVTDLIAKGIDIHAVNKFNQFKINVFVGVESINPEVLLEEYLSGNLDTNGSFVND